MSEPSLRVVDPEKMDKEKAKEIYYEILEEEKKNEIPSLCLFESSQK